MSEIILVKGNDTPVWGNLARSYFGILIGEGKLHVVLYILIAKDLGLPTFYMALNTWTCVWSYVEYGDVVSCRADEFILLFRWCYHDWPNHGLHIQCYVLQRCASTSRSGAAQRICQKPNVCFISVLSCADAFMCDIRVCQCSKLPFHESPI